jgi:hypothetical protein
MTGDVRCADLIRKLSAQGWEVVRRDRDGEWWADEIWEVESVWAPRGFTAFLTWLREPDDEATVWGLGASLARPTDRLGASAAACISINGWPRDVPGFLSALAALRDRAQLDRTEGLS